VKKRRQSSEIIRIWFKNFSTVEAVKKGATFGPVKVRRGKVNQVILTAAKRGG